MTVKTPEEWAERIVKADIHPIMAREVAEVIREAVLAEREQCAQIADQWASDAQRLHGNGGPAAAIRNRES